MNTWNKLIAIRENGAGYFILIDPDKIDEKRLPSFVQSASDAGVDAFLVGGSLVLNDNFDSQLKVINENTSRPVILFPGSLFQISKNADALLFLILISGRNPDHIIGNQVVAAPIIRKMGLETISTGYMLIGTGKTTSAEFMSNTKPIPSHKPDIAVAHAMAAEMMGIKLLYLDAGSGADQSVPNEMIGGINHYCSLPMIIGGGIRTPEELSGKVAAGASFVVTGTITEEQTQISLIKEFADAAHNTKRTRK